MKLTPEQIYAVCRQAGFSPDQAVTWTAIAMAESGGDTEAHNPRGEDSWGLFQVNVDPEVRPNHWGDLTDPLVNAKAAFEISGGGTNLRPWTVTHARNEGTAHDYRNFMDEARAAADGAYAGDFSGVTGYHDPSPTGGDEIPAVPGGPAVATGEDSDADGALDAFEMSAGTDPQLPDSDADGLTDGFEILHQLDPSQVDSDQDGLSDRMEIDLRTNARDADTDHDGLADALEIAAGRDPLHGLAPGTVAPGAGGDQDQDGMSDAWEQALGTDPGNADTDHDGLADALEQAASQDPLNPDSDHDGTLDVVDHDEPADLPPVVPLAVDVGAVAAAAPAPVATEPTDLGDPTKVQQFLDAALGQSGDSYVFGAEAQAGDVDPDTFDCSELTQWAASQVGVSLPDGSWIQYLQLKEQGNTVSVEEALRTPGALLFSFPSEPTAGGARPKGAHVAISLGDGRTIEARNPRAGVGTWEAGDRFGYAAVLPELGDPAAVMIPPLDGAPLAPAPGDPGTDSDQDGLTDVYEMSAGTDPRNGDSDHDGLTDGFEVVLAQGGGGPLGPDADQDGLADQWEQQHGSDALVVDTDGDGLSDGWEARMGSDAAVADSDHDGVADGLETAAGRDALHGIAPGTRPDLLIDADGDGLSDAWEHSIGSDAALADSDHDGLGDALELAHHTNPHDPDSDHDGILDAHDDDPTPDR